MHWSMTSFDAFVDLLFKYNGINYNPEIVRYLQEAVKNMFK